MIFHPFAIGQLPSLALPSRHPHRNGIDEKVGVGVYAKLGQSLFLGQLDRYDGGLDFTGVVGRSTTDRFSSISIEGEEEELGSV